MWMIFLIVSMKKHQPSVFISRTVIGSSVGVCVFSKISRCHHTKSSGNCTILHYGFGFHLKNSIYNSKMSVFVVLSWFIVSSCCLGCGSQSPNDTMSKGFAPDSGNCLQCVHKLSLLAEYMVILLTLSDLSVLFLKKGNSTKN